MDKFMKELRDLCCKHDASIYPGFTDEFDEELGTVLKIGKRVYSLEDVSGVGYRVEKIPGEEY